MHSIPLKQMARIDPGTIRGGLAGQTQNGLASRALSAKFGVLTDLREPSTRAARNAIMLQGGLMPVEPSYPHIEKMEDASARLQRLPRVRVAQIVVDYLNHGWSADEICIHYPHLKPAEVHSAMAYYFDHQAEIDTEIEAEQRQIEDSRKNAKPTSVELRLRAQGLAGDPARFHGFGVGR
jgi:hypothetical protein